MSLSPESIPEQLLDPPRPKRSWQSRLLSICFIIFTFEIGAFLAIIPWMEESWSLNLFQEWIPGLQAIWIDPFFRGAITGLGLVNIYIACRELVRLFRRA